MRKLKAYMAYNRKAGPQKGTFLIFHYDISGAKKIAWPHCRDSICEEYIDMGITEINDAPWLFDEMKGEGPQIIVNPKSCNACFRWGHTPIDDEGMCESCKNGGDYD